MTQLKSNTASVSIERELHRRRLWYHDIEVVDGLRTRFAEDYDVNPDLERVDASGRQLLGQLGDELPSDLSGLSAADVGCADGLVAFWAARRGASRVLGIERNRYNYEHAEFIRSASGLDNVAFRCGGVERMLDDETFDFVFCLGLIYHLIDPLGTLNALRARCRGKLFITSAVDLDGNGDEPLCRLDRYASGAHGFWSFNTAMIRQYLTTAGFEIQTESIEDSPGGAHYFAVATPGRFSAHHIFDETLDQEFPINVDRRRARVREAWTKLAGSTRRPVAIFGAGTHTPWLLDQVRDIGGVQVSCVLDDRIPVGGTVAGLPCIRPTEVDTDSLGAVVISSWHQADVLRRRAQDVFGGKIKTVSLDV